MNRFVDYLPKKKFFHSLSGVADSDILDAENTLALSFFPEYREYLSKYGVCSVEGHEFTGLGTTKRLDVVENTLLERQHTVVPTNWYVIEQADIDGIVIWQSSTGEIYQTAPNVEPIKLCDSLSEYLDL